MDWGWIPAVLGIVALAFQLSFKLGKIEGRLVEIGRRLERLEKVTNGIRGGG